MYPVLLSPEILGYFKIAPKLLTAKSKSAPVRPKSASPTEKAKFLQKQMKWGQEKCCKDSWLFSRICELVLTI